MSRVLGLLVFIFAFALTEWAFRFGLSTEPIDSFLRLMTLVFDGFLLVFALAMVWQKDGPKSRIKHLFRNFPRITLAFIGLFLSFFTVMVAEFSCRFYFKHCFKAPYSESTFWQPSVVVFDAQLGSRLPNDTVITHAYTVNDSLVYQQHYRMDRLARRETASVWPDSAYRQFAMITGCSFAFGYGLSDEHTLSHYVDSLTQFRAYNYGVPGHGTQQTLALLQSRKLRSEMPEPNGTLVHLFIDDHMKRLIGSRRLINLWARDFPYYRLEGNELKHDGTFLTGRQLLSRFYRVISQSSFIALFDIEVPWYVSSSHLKLFGAVLREAKKEFMNQYPTGRFVVVIAPGSKLAPRVCSTLEANDVEVLDLSELLDKDNSAYRIHWTEAHPNGRYYLHVAVALKQYLIKTQSTRKPQ